MPDFVIRIVDSGGTARDPTTFGQPDGTVTPGVDLFARPADNHPGSVASVAPGATASVVTYTPSVLWQVEGFICRGTGDANVMLAIAGVNFYPEKLNIFRPAAVLLLPRPHQVAANALIAMSVTASLSNTASADFFGVILGRAV